MLRLVDEAGGEAATQYLPAYHYLMGYLELERGNFETAKKHLEQGDLNDPFQKLLLARSYEGLSRHTEARKLYQEILESTNNGLERALAYPEAQKKLTAL